MRLGESYELAAQALEKASQTNDPLLNATAQYNAGETLFWLGELKKSQEHMNRALQLFDKVSADAVVRTYGYDWWMAAAFFLGWIELIFGKPALSVGWENRCVHRSLKGDKRAGLAEMKIAADKLDELDSRIMSAWRLALLAIAHIELEEYRAAEDACARAIALIGQTDERWCEAEAYRVTAEAILRNPKRDLVQADKHLRKAIEIAQNQGARWWELRATVSLARLLRDTDRRDEARAMLSEIYNWFTEGFDTVDLKDAKALLDELSDREA